ncbi:MAG: hypothetical protein ABFD25_18745 [Clostridiaceae bacterium]
MILTAFVFMSLLIVIVEKHGCRELPETKHLVILIGLHTFNRKSMLIIYSETPNTPGTLISGRNAAITSGGGLSELQTKGPKIQKNIRGFSNNRRIVTSRFDHIQIGFPLLS